MITPLGIHILIEPLEESKAFQLPEQSKGQAESGLVLGVGSKVDIEVKVGDKVLFKKYSPEEFEVEGKMVYLVEEQDLMGVVV